MLYQPLARQVMCWMLLHGKTGVGDGWLWGLDSIFRPSSVVNILVMQEAYVKGVSNWNFNVSDLKKQADMEHLDPVPEATAGATCLACVLRLDLGKPLLSGMYTTILPTMFLNVHPITTSAHNVSA